MVSLPEVILASNSPRRKQLLALCGWDYSACPAELDETPLIAETAQNYVMRLAESKAHSAADKAGDRALVIAADTAVVDGDAILGKPHSPADAFRMLERLRGHTHQVYTALAVLRIQDNTLLSDLCITDVPMRQYTDTEMDAYISSGDPLDKAGAYAIQHAGFHPVASLDGCYANVVGLPLCHLARSLKKLGVPMRDDLPQACQNALGYTCLIFEKVLEERL